MSKVEKSSPTKEEKLTKTELLTTDSNTVKGISVAIELLSEEHSDFYIRHSSDSYNPLETRMNLTGAYCITIRKQNILSMVLSIPHTLYIHSLGLIKAVL